MRNTGYIILAFLLLALLAGGLESRGIDSRQQEKMLRRIELGFREQQYRSQLDSLGKTIRGFLRPDVSSAPGLQVLSSGGVPGASPELLAAVDEILERMQDETGELYAEVATRKSDFFRDLAGSRDLHRA